MTSKRNQTALATPPRIGTVPYCNAWPLVQYLSSEMPGVFLSEWIPATMRLRLMAHHLDLAMMPVAELMNLPAGRIVGNCCIASRGPVRSVRIIARKPIEQIRTISLDTASRSSVAICEVVLRHFYDLKPIRYRLSADRPLESCRADAFLVIGDRALAYRPTDRWEFRYDLAELWREKTGLPLVFAAWIACSERVWKRTGIVSALQNARDRALEDINRLLDEKEHAGVALPVGRSEMYSYFTESIVYRLGDEERLSLQSFFDLAVLHGLTRHRTLVDVVEE